LTDLLFKQLDKDAIIESFDCGERVINSFLTDLALLNQERKLSKTYVFCLKDSNIVIAFLTLSASQLNTGDASIFGIDKVPIVLLGRLGVDKKYKHKNLGNTLIKIALEKSLEASKIIACRLLLVETTLDMKNYYLEKVNMGFEWFRDRKNNSILFIDLKKYEENIH
jgi:predicted GNAT family N-acyltransferase